MENSRTVRTHPLSWQVCATRVACQVSGCGMKRFITTKNPHGTITNSDLDLELAASLVQKDIAAHHYNVREHTIALGSNNIAAVS